MTTAPSLLIAGGGIAGLATALALARCGFASTVLERRPELSEAGAGIQIGPNGVRVLQSLGVLAGLEAAVAKPAAIIVHAGGSGRILQTLPLGDWIAKRHGTPYLVAHRRDLQAALATAVAAEPLIKVTFGFDVGSILPSGDGVAVQARDGRRMEGCGLIAADGLFSVARGYVAGGDVPLAFSGRTAARTVIPAESVSALLECGSTGVWLSPNAHVVHYPVSSGREIAVVVVREEDWRSQDWDTAVARDTVLASLRTYAPCLQQALAKADAWRRWALYVAPPLKRWSRGRVVLAGDAAHPVLPFLAQGGCLALEDAVVLAAAVAAIPHDLPGAFRVFEDARRSRTSRMQAASRRNGRIYHLDGIAATARDFALGALPAARVMAGYDWIYGWRPPAKFR